MSSDDIILQPRTGQTVEAQPAPSSTVPLVLSHQRLQTAEELEAERPVWDDWVAQRYDGNPFLSLDWHLVWLKHFAAPPVEVHYIKVSDQDKPVAYFPLVLKRESFHGVKVRTLRYAGNMYSPINSPLFGVADAAPIFDYFVQHVLTTIPWHLFRGGNLPPEYPGPVELYQAFQKAGYASYLDEDRANWVYHNEGITAEEFYSHLGRRLRQDIRQSSSRLAKAGDFQFRLVTSDLTPKDVEDYKLAYNRSWRNSESYPAFHPELMEVMARRGVLRLGLFYLNQRPIATAMWLFRQGRGYAVKMAYDEAFEGFNPGKALMWMMVERLMKDDAMTFFDYLKGDHEWKKRWTNTRRTRSWLLAFQKGPTGKTLHFMDQRLLPWIRRNRFLDACKRKAGFWLQRRRARDGRTEGQ